MSNRRQATDRFQRRIREFEIDMSVTKLRNDFFEMRAR